ncbi:MAG: zinc ribbon domain-containing protein [Chloroflexota bacterium]
MSFLRRNRKNQDEAPPPPTPVQEEITAQQFSLKLTFLARSSDGLRLPADPTMQSMLPSVVEPLAIAPVEVLQPVGPEVANAAPNIEQLAQLQQWITARAGASPIAHHALYVLESTDAVDMTVDTFVCALLHGETETSGYPAYNAIVGGLASHWDELSGDLIVRAVVGWGGKGQRGDTERHGARLLSSLYQQVRATGHSLGAAAASRATAIGDRGGAVCAHCGFESAEGAFYCPKCGMRMGGHSA